MTAELDSPAAKMIRRLVFSLGKDVAHRAIDVALQKFTTIELAALAAHWNFWARPKQLPPNDLWQSWGFLTGRGFGKTLSISKHINDEVESGRAKLICLIAQDEQSAVDIQVKGPSGLIATAPPWNKPEWVASELQIVWPNGARAYVRTPEVPGKIRGLEYHLAWCSELQSWPTATREEAWSNVLLSTRLGYARIVWDATPKRRHPILKSLLAEAEADPVRNVVVRGTTFENAANLGDGYVEKLVKKYGGTQKGEEELGGKMFDDDDTGLVKQKTLDDNRRAMPARFRRKAIGVDPAVTARKGSDRTGINLSGLGMDDRLYVLKDLSGKHAPEAWAALVLDTYVDEECDVVVVETNKGGDLLVRNLRAEAKERKLTIEVVDEKWRPHRRPGTVFVREIYSRGEKSERATPLATAYQRNRVSHVISGDFVALEEILTTWVPESGQRSPDPLEALVQVATELLGLDDDTPDASTGFHGIAELGKVVASQTSSPLNLAAILGGGGLGGRI